ncbi:MAG: chemotaxis response regulator protein-glutamate methylesterase [Clostridium sp.]|nr:chemotaxis response regulator protein-glutamate methylesterase [Clostridium sp.]
MSKIKVAIVDDSAFMRRIIADSLAIHNDIEVVAKFRNGKELIDQYEKYKPDIITLDVEMPIMNGLETLKILKNKKISTPVIMLSSLTSENSVHTIECLALGATDFVEKPSISIMKDSNIFGNILIEKIIAISKSKLEFNEDKKSSKKINYIIHKAEKPIKAVVIGASTGGPRALQTVLTKIDGNINVPIFVVQHMPKGFTKAFAERLNTLCALKVVEAEHGMKIEKNTIYIAKGGYHMVVGKNNEILLNEEPSIWGVRPAVDKLFESSVQVYGGNILSAVLTGMGRDGAHGTEVIKDNGGITISEDKSTCVIYGMPKAAYETGKVDMVIELQSIAEKINTLVKGSTI